MRAMIPKQKPQPIYFSRKISLLLLLLVNLLTSACSTYRSEVKWKEDETEINLFHTIPLYRLNRLLLIKGKVSGEEGYFIFDTGAPGLVLNTTHFDDFTLDPTRTYTGVNGNKKAAQVYYARHIYLGNIPVKPQMADAIDLSHIEDKRKVKILGLVGVRLFKGVELEIDLNRHTLSLYKTDKQGLRLLANTRPTSTAGITIPFKYSGALIALQAQINDKAYRIAFDTGSETLLLDRDIMERDSIKTSISNAQELLSTDGKRSQIEIRQLPEINIGLNLTKVTTVATNLRPLRSHGLNVDGLIGYDLMASGIVTINFKNQTLHIQPYARA
jgi:predicted aspartyl protease